MGLCFVILFLSKLKCILQCLFVHVLLLKERINTKQQISVYLLANYDRYDRSQIPKVVCLGKRTINMKYVQVSHISDQDD